MNAEDVNLYLVGFMGTGKTTVGRAVAVRLGFDFVDSDIAIEKEQGRAVAEIFARDGEAAFRAMERKFILNHPAQRTVVACGGGLVVQPGMTDLLATLGVTICLHASIETILERTGSQGDRPLLAVANPTERARRLFAEREPIYRQAGTLVLTDGRSVRDIATHVVRIWRREAAEFVRVRRSSGSDPAAGSQ